MTAYMLNYSYARPFPFAWLGPDRRFTPQTRPWLHFFADLLLHAG